MVSGCLALLIFFRYASVVAELLQSLNAVNMEGMRGRLFC
jgi:hypothetical protein